MLLAVGVAGCGGASGSPSASDADYRVVASTSLFADLARLALGDTVQIDAIVPAGIDVHTFEPAPSDVSKIAGADLVLMNGLGLDDWVVSLVDAAKKSDANVLRLGEGLESYGFEYLLDGDGAETGATVLADLYSDALGAAPGDTYLGAMQANATAIAESMQP